jgi:hypothetical protein
MAAAVGSLAAVKVVMAEAGSEAGATVEETVAVAREVASGEAMVEEATAATKEATAVTAEEMGVEVLVGTQEAPLVLGVVARVAGWAGARAAVLREVAATAVEGRVLECAASAVEEAKAREREGGQEDVAMDPRAEAVDVEEEKAEDARAKAAMMATAVALEAEKEHPGVSREPVAKVACEVAAVTAPAEVEWEVAAGTAGRGVVDKVAAVLQAARAAAAKTVEPMGLAAKEEEERVAVAGGLPAMVAAATALEVLAMVAVAGQARVGVVKVVEAMVVVKVRVAMAEGWEVAATVGGTAGAGAAEGMGGVATGVEEARGAAG